LIGAPMPRSGRWRAGLRFDRELVGEAVALRQPSLVVRDAELGDRRRAQGGGADLTIARLPNHSASKRGFHSVSFSSGSVASKLCATNSRMASRSLTF